MTSLNLGSETGCGPQAIFRVKDDCLRVVVHDGLLSTCRYELDVEEENLLLTFLIRRKLERNPSWGLTEL